MASKRSSDGDTQGSEKKRFKSSFKEVVTVAVGADDREEKFIVHQDVICARSPYFRAACAKAWTEGQEKLMALAEHPADCFRIYLAWIYAGNGLLDLAIAVAQARADKYKAKHPHANEIFFRADRHSLKALCELWILGDYLGDASFTNAVIDAIYDAHSKRSNQIHVLYTPEAISKAFLNTRADCNLQRYLIDHAVDCFSGEDFRRTLTCCEPFKSALLLEAAKRFVAFRGETRKITNASDYHEATEETNKDADTEKDAKDVNKDT